MELIRTGSPLTIVCTASLRCNAALPSHNCTKSKALLVLSGRGAAVALVALRQDLGTDCARTPWSLNEPRKLSHAEGPRACDDVLGLRRRPPCRPQSVPRIKSAGVRRRDVEGELLGRRRDVVAHDAGLGARACRVVEAVRVREARSSRKATVLRSSVAMRDPTGTTQCLR